LAQTDKAQRPMTPGLALKRAKGVEPSTNVADSAGNHGVSEVGGVKAALTDLAVTGIDPDLADVARVWAHLPLAVRKMIVGLVRLRYVPSAEEMPG
jgi:hypothetical protein